MTDSSNKLMQAFFSPAVALMNHLDVTRKFVLLGLMSLVAIAVVVHSLFASLDQVISSSRRELKGLELIKPFPRAVQALQQHRGLSSGLLGGNETMRGSRASKEGEAVEALNEMWGKPFHGMASSEGLQHIKADWGHLRKEWPYWTAAENFAAHTRLINRIQSFEGIVADEYALILDPELGTFYLIDTIVNKLPQALEHLGQLRAHCTGILAKKQVTAQQKIEINILIAELDDALGMLKINLDKTGRYNPALQGLISAASRNITDSAQQITGLMASDILTGHFATLPNDFFGMSTAVIDKSYTQLYETLLPMAETLIKARVARAENTLRTSIGIASLLFLAVVYFSIGVCRAIIGNIRSLARSARAFAGGDLRERIDLGARDELGRVGDSFNEMADGFSALLKVSHENEARLHELSVHLEDRVRKRTEELEEQITERKLAMLALQDSERHLSQAQSIAHIGSWYYDLISSQLRWSDELYRIYGVSPETFTPNTEAFINLLHPDDRPAMRAWIDACALGQKPGALEFRCIWPDGTIRHVIGQSELIHDGDKPSRLSGTVQDITERKKAEEKLRIAAVTFETHEAILIADASANIIRVNRAFTDITGYSPEEVLGKNPRILSSGRQDKAFYAAMWQQLLNTGSWAGEMWDRRKSGQIYPKWLTITAVKNGGGKTTEYVAIFNDITARKQAEEEIHNMAFYDALTRLPNRRLFLDRFRAALPASARHNNFGAVLFIDLDRFKLLNDTLGHDYGDLLLIEVAVRIKACVREMDTVARLGGDEFVVLIESISDDQHEASYKVGLVAEKIRESLARPYDLNGHEHHNSPSIGVSLYCGNEEPVDELLQHADMAMYQAKDSGRNAVRFFDPVMQNNVATRAALVNDLRSAIAHRQLHLHYQLQVDNDNRPVGAEALLRWFNPQRGLVMPEQFLPIAEESTLVLDIGDWVLETACRQLALWSINEKMRDLVLTVNISAKQFALPDFVDKVAHALRTHQINPARLKLELTESMALDDLSSAVEKMHALKALGVLLSMDDFGTRYSSLSNLKQLPLDQLKLGRSFVQDIASDGNVALLVQSIIDLSSKYRITVIAEGVENEAQLTSLKDRDCVAYQGFLFSKALSIEEFEQLLNRS